MTRHEMEQILSGSYSTRSTSSFTKSNYDDFSAPIPHRNARIIVNVRGRSLALSTNRTSRMAAPWLDCSDRSDSSSSSYVSRPSPLRSDSEKRSDSKEYEDDSDSPPSYAVIEDKYGNLVSKALNVIWPQRPEKGRYSLDEYKKRKAHQKELRQKKEERLARKRERQRRKRQAGMEAAEVRGNVQAKSADLPSGGDHKSEICEKPASMFAGVLAHSQLRRLLRPTEFRLYYSRPETITSLAEVPIQMPLKLAYMSTSGKLYQFGFNEIHSKGGNRRWQLNLGAFSKQEQPVFKSMRSLIKYYESYANIQRNNGTTEIFPIDEE